MELSKQGKISGLDELRGLAALLVLVYHLYQSFFRGIPNYNSSGNLIFPDSFDERFNFLNEFNAGVNLFFILSGFLIHSIYTKSTFDRGVLKSFLFKRFLRIIPPYYFSMSIAIIGGLVIKYFDISIFDVIYHLLFINNLKPEHAFTIQAVYWSIAVEVQFYIFYALFRYATDSINMKHKLLYFFFITFFISIVYKLTLYHYSSNLAGLRWEILYNSILRFPEWLLGALAFEYRHYFLKYKYKMHLFFILIIVTPFLNNYFLNHLLICDILYGIAFSFLILAVTENDFSFKPLKFLGQISYSMYLNHFLIYSVWDTVLMKIFGLEKVPSLERFFIQFSGLFVAIIGSYILYILIEKPSQKIKSKLAFSSELKGKPI
jgi:peptidoglycan/LPS O-acetylase OafA/YrhL